MTVMPTAEDPARISRLPIDDTGKLTEPNPHFDDWDVTPHAFFTVGVGQVTIADMVLGGTHQVVGFGAANQRGVDARRFDLECQVGPSAEGSARLVLPTDHRLEIKRYLDTPVAYVKLVDDDRPHDAGLIVDYGEDTGLECVHSYSICDRCEDDWDSDYDLVRWTRA